MKLDEILQEFRNQIGTDFIRTQVVGMDGLSISTISADRISHESSVAARSALIMKLGMTISEKLSLGGVEDNLITTDKLMFITRFLGDHSLFWSVTVGKNATLGMVRLLMNEYAPKIWEAIPH